MYKIKSTEKQVQATISAYLTVNNIIHWRVNSGAMKIKSRFIRFAYWLWPTSTKIREYTFLDLQGVLNDGRALYVECKATNEKPTVAQQNTINLIVRRNGVAFYADSLEMCVKKLKEFKVKLKVTA